MIDKKLVEFLDDCANCGESCPAVWHDKEKSEAVLTEIKEKLRLVLWAEDVAEAQKLDKKDRSPDDDLVEKITILAERSIDEPEFHDSCNDYDFKEDYFKKELRKLLQSRQPERVTVTREEIAELLVRLSAEFRRYAKYTKEIDVQRLIEIVEEWIKLK